MRRLSIPFALAVTVISFATHAETIEEKAQVCAACHGENGVPPEQSVPVPVIWGQNLGYLFFQLRDFKSGARKDQLMSPIAEPLERDDLMALAQYFSKKPWPKLAQPHPPADVAALAQRANASVVCTSCHQDGFIGDRHAAAPRRPGPRLSGKDHDGFPQRRPRQQSGHDRLDEGHHAGGYRGAGGVAWGDVTRHSGAPPQAASPEVHIR